MRIIRHIEVPVGIINFVAITGVFICLCFISAYKYLLFHTFIEIFSVIICCCVFVVSTFTYNRGKNAFSVLGLGYLVVGIIDLLHTMSYQGMNVIEPDNAYVTQLWISARFIEAVTIILFLVQMKRKVTRFRHAFLIYFAVLLGVVLSIFVFKSFPVCVLPGQVQTPFKIVAEIVTSVILVIAFIHLKTKRPIANKKIERWFSLSIILILLSELCLTLYRDSYGILNVSSHLLKAVAYYCVYKSILLINVQDPLTIIFDELTKKEQRIMLLLSELETEKNAAVKSSITDGLTGIRNRRYFDEIMTGKYESAKRDKRELSILMIDIDFFKNYNDEYGHVLGDDCLRKVANALQSVLNRASDALVRYGGEEFIAILENTDKAGALLIANNMRNAVSDMKINHEKSTCAQFVTVSVGTVTINNFIHDSVDEIVQLADKALYRAKTNGRNRVESGDYAVVEQV